MLSFSLLDTTAVLSLKEETPVQAYCDRLKSFPKALSESTNLTLPFLVTLPDTIVFRNSLTAL